MNNTYYYHIKSSVEHDNYYVVKTHSGRFFELPKPILIKLKSLVQPDGSLDCMRLGEHTIKNLLDKNIISKKEVSLSAKRFKYHWRKALINGSNLHKINSALTITINLRFLFIYLLSFLLMTLYFNAELKNIFLNVTLNHFIQNTTFSDLIITFMLIIMSGLFHEFGHSVAHFKYTRTSNEIGVCINYVMPSFYTDVSDVVLLRNKYEKIYIGIAGLYYQLLLYPLIMIYTISFHNTNVLVMYSWIFAFQIVLNLFPAMRNDGYWIYRDLFNIKKFVSTRKVRLRDLPKREIALYMLAIPVITYLIYFVYRGVLNMVDFYLNGINSLNFIDIIRIFFTLIYLVFGCKIAVSILCKRITKLRHNNK